MVTIYAYIERMWKKKKIQSQQGSRALQPDYFHYSSSFRKTTRIARVDLEYFPNQSQVAHEMSRLVYTLLWTSIFWYQYRIMNYTFYL